MTRSFLEWPAQWRPNHDREYRLNATTYVLSVANGYFIFLTEHACQYPCNGSGAYVDSHREVDGFLRSHGLVAA